MAAIDIDVSRWPLVVTTPPAGRVSDGELDDFYARFEEHAQAHDGSYVCILDLTRHTGLTPAQRKRIAGSMTAESRSGAVSAGTAMVFSSGLLRATLTAILWLRRPTHPVKVFETIAEAEAWAGAVLDGLRGQKA